MTTINGKHRNGRQSGDESRVAIRNENIKNMEHDILYHLALATHTHDLVRMFGDVKFVCMGGAPQRMEHFANYLATALKDVLPPGTQVQDLKECSYRYSLYKIGPILSVSHGMGVPSMQILLHEVIKLMYHAKCKDPIFFRIGTCGGIGIEPGSVVITEEAVDEMLKPQFEQVILGKKVSRPSILDSQMVSDLKSLADPSDAYATVSGKTMCANDFYEGQGRIDGAFCDYTEADKNEYLKKLQDHGVVNIEMECVGFAALTHHAGIKAAIVCAPLLNRLKGDQVSAPKELLNEWQIRPQELVSRYIKRYLQNSGSIN